MHAPTAQSGHKQSLSMAANVTATSTFLCCKHKDEQKQYDASYPNSKLSIIKKCHYSIIRQKENKEDHKVQCVTVYVLEEHQS